MGVASFRDLRVWQASMDLVQSVYRHTRCFPVVETYGLASQLRRASVSVPSNIAEGHAREHLAEYLHHLSIAQGSLAEVETQIEIAAGLGYMDDGERSTCIAQIDQVRRQLIALRKALSKGT